MIGRIGDIDGVGDGTEERLKAGFRLALFPELVECLFGFDDLFARLARNFDPSGLVGDDPAKRHEFSADSEIVYHLSVVTRRKRRNRGPGKTGKIGRPT